MTLLNVHVSPRRGLVAVNSLLVEQRADGSHGDALGLVKNLCHFERAGCVMASRGMARMGMYLRGFLGDGAAVDSFDSIERAIPAALLQAQRRLLEEAQRAGVDCRGGTAVRLVGYSRRLGRVLAVAFDQSAPGERLRREVLTDEDELAPWHAEQGPMPACDSVARMRAAAFAQIDFQATLRGSQSTVGGDVFIASVVPEGVRIHRFDAILGRHGRTAGDAPLNLSGDDQANVLHGM